MVLDFGCSRRQPKLSGKEKILGVNVILECLTL